MNSALAPTDLVLLWSAKMTPVKAPFLLVEALAALPEAVRRRFWFVAMGDGPLRQSFEAQLKGLLPGRTRFLGFCNQSEIGRGYAMADALVFPSTQGETWGLVVNEALQFGLAVIASDHPGCVADLLSSERLSLRVQLCFPVAIPALLQMLCWRLQWPIRRVSALSRALIFPTRAIWPAPFSIGLAIRPAPHNASRA